MAHHILLPRQDDDRLIAGLPVTGEWHECGLTMLKDISESRDASRDNVKSDSIPDMWARTFIFKQALYDNKHPLHTLVTGEWRGLLAALALSKCMNIELVHQDIEVGGKGEFLRCLNQLLPTETIEAQTSWGKMFIFLVDQKPIGMTSPTTLICTSTDYFGFINRNDIPWVNKGYLTDPSKVNISRDAKLMLAGWIVNLRDSLDDQYDNVTLEIRTQLREALNSFIADLTGHKISVINGNQVNIPVPDLIEIEEKFDHGIFGVLNKIIKSPELDPWLSNVRLLNDLQAQDRSQFNNGAIMTHNQEFEKSPDTEEVIINPAPVGPPKPILIIDGEIATEWRMKKNEIRVAGLYTLEDIKNMPRHVTDSMHLWDKNDIFTKRLTIVKNKRAFNDFSRQTHVAGMDNFDFTPLIPLKKAVLEHLTAAHLRENIRFARHGTDILVELTLVLSGFSKPDTINIEEENESNVPEKENSVAFEDENIQLEHGDLNDVPREGPLAYKMKKIYRQADIDILLNTPNLTIWPNIVREGWKQYFIYCSTGLQPSTFTVAPFEEDIKPGSLPEEGIVYSTAQYPEALICHPSGLAAQDSTPRRLRESCGFLLVGKPDPVYNKHFKINIGIDFGTTGTNVFFNYDANTKQAKFASLILELIKTDRRGNIFECFLPIADRFEDNSGFGIALPFMSILQEFKGGSMKSKLLPFKDGHIYFIKDSLEFDALKEGMKTNLKWGEEHEIHRAEVFLMQLSIMCAAEAARLGADSISWRYSYPTAFSPTKRSNFDFRWKDICKSIDTGSFKTGNSSAPLNISESLATARYFQNPRSGTDLGRLREGAVTVDIGGGTSDIAIWQGTGVIFQTSVKYAGRDIFLAPLSDDAILSEFLNRMISAAEISINEDILSRKLNSLISLRSKEHAAFNAQIDALISRNGERVLSNLGDAQRDNININKFLQLAALGLSGLLYYIGIVIRALSSQGKYNATVMPQILAGGNGSRIFDWLAGGKFQSSTVINKLFEAIMRESTGINCPLNIKISNEFKSEVAYGLVTDDHTISWDGEVEDKIVSGEEFTINEKRYHYYDILNTALLHDEKHQNANGIESKIRVIPEHIFNFFKVFNRHIDKMELETIRFGDREKNMLVKDLETILLKEWSKEKKDITLEPVFIVELRQVLRILAIRRT